jgi:hypothetical protein
MVKLEVNVMTPRHSRHSPHISSQNKLECLSLEVYQMLKSMCEQLVFSTKPEINCQWANTQAYSALLSLEPKVKGFESIRRH